MFGLFSKKSKRIEDQQVKKETKVFTVKELLEGFNSLYADEVNTLSTAYKNCYKKLTEKLKENKSIDQLTFDEIYPLIELLAGFLKKELYAEHIMNDGYLKSLYYDSKLNGSVIYAIETLINQIINVLEKQSKPYQQTKQIQTLIESVVRKIPDSDLKTELKSLIEKLRVIDNIEVTRIQGLLQKLSVSKELLPYYLIVYYPEELQELGVYEEFNNNQDNLIQIANKNFENIKFEEICLWIRFLSVTAKIYGEQKKRIDLYDDIPGIFSAIVELKNLLIEKKWNLEQNAIDLTEEESKQLDAVVNALSDLQASEIFKADITSIDKISSIISEISDIKRLLPENAPAKQDLDDVQSVFETGENVVAVQQAESKPVEESKEELSEEKAPTLINDDENYQFLFDCQSKFNEILLRETTVEQYADEIDNIRKLQKDFFQYREEVLIKYGNVKGDIPHEQLRTFLMDEEKDEFPRLHFLKEKFFENYQTLKKLIAFKKKYDEYKELPVSTDSSSLFVELKDKYEGLKALFDENNNKKYFNETLTENSSFIDSAMGAYEKIEKKLAKDQKKLERLQELEQQAAKFSDVEYDLGDALEKSKEYKDFLQSLERMSTKYPEAQKIKDRGIQLRVKKEYKLDYERYSLLIHNTGVFFEKLNISVNVFPLLSKVDHQTAIGLHKELKKLKGLLKSNNENIKKIVNDSLYSLTKLILFHNILLYAELKTAKNPSAFHNFSIGFLPGKYLNATNGPGPLIRSIRTSLEKKEQIVSELAKHKEVLSWQDQLVMIKEVGEKILGEEKPANENYDLKSLRLAFLETAANTAEEMEAKKDKDGLVSLKGYFEKIKADKFLTHHRSVFYIKKTDTLEAFEKLEQRIYQAITRLNKKEEFKPQFTKNHLAFDMRNGSLVLTVTHAKGSNKIATAASLQDICSQVSKDKPETFSMASEQGSKQGSVFFGACEQILTISLQANNPDPAAQAEEIVPAANDSVPNYKENAAMQKIYEELLDKMVKAGLIQQSQMDSAMASVKRIYPDEPKHVVPPPTFSKY